MDCTITSDISAYRADVAAGTELRTHLGEKEWCNANKGDRDGSERIHDGSYESVKELGLTADGVAITGVRNVLSCLLHEQWQWTSERDVTVRVAGYHHDSCQSSNVSTFRARCMLTYRERWQVCR